jgi:hypothetical protein
MPDSTKNRPRCEQGNSTATPGCGCTYCSAVFDEWGEQALGFQQWLDGLNEVTRTAYFGNGLATNSLTPDHDSDKVDS